MGRSGRPIACTAKLRRVTHAGNGRLRSATAGRSELSSYGSMLARTRRGLRQNSVPFPKPEHRAGAPAATGDRRCRSGLTRQVRPATTAPPHFKSCRETCDPPGG
ncbi:hypothetical protein AAFF_G00359620 [Aldrovandia affinis]|uniref:Uncharacterized protein n=1 Tax=Aldrovandia affinis TaxID=143900 RepID=A0AAD7WN12_9TELE|nr:hypothetical protein AAFF_G00359620 [Aldrovandia affinis]